MTKNSCIKEEIRLDSCKYLQVALCTLLKNEEVEYLIIRILI